MIFENRCPVFLLNIQGFKEEHLNSVNRKCLIGSSAYRRSTKLMSLAKILREFVNSIILPLNTYCPDTGN